MVRIRTPFRYQAAAIANTLRRELPLYATEQDDREVRTDASMEQVIEAALVSGVRRESVTEVLS